jgi:asparagine synthase (glutamine-hydrolysing)
MCGINGFAGAPGGLEVVARMNDALLHRGPDEGGVLDLGFAALGMRRLSIVDVRDGHQPMGSSDGRFHLVYNGELYDFELARRALQARGLEFRTRSDTEVVLQSWVADGEACLRGFNGMFAFALADARERSVTLVRDVVGIKPLYYWHGPAGELAFSSELGSLLAHPSVPRRLDRRSLEMLLMDRYVADPYTLLEGVRQLPPGHLLRWRDGALEIRVYDQLRFEPLPTEEPRALDELRDVLDRAVRSQLVADVPVGVFLSGGIDSSTVAAFASRAVEHPLKSFSVGFARRSYDESGLAREVARHLGTEHHEVRVENALFDLESLDTILDHVGQPLGDTSCIPTLIVSKLAAEHVKVVLSGDGGDEFFGGYDHMFWAARIRRVAERTPALVRRLGQAVLAGVAPVAPRGLAERTRRSRKGVELTFLPADQRFRRMMSLFSPKEIGELCAHGRPHGDVRPAFRGDLAALEALRAEEAAMALLAGTSLPGAILTKVDRMSMAASLEVRVPLLDRRVLDFALRLPLELKVRGGVGKHLLREASRPLLPASVFAHKKQGFSIPLFDWFNAEFWSLLDELYLPGSRAARLFRPAALAQVLREGRSAGARTGVVSENTAASRVWLLAMLARWMERFGVES